MLQKRRSAAPCCTREQILTILRDAAPEWISSEVIIGKLNISRMAVSKHVATLKKQGYSINSAQHRGYQFQEAPNLLLPEEIRYCLPTSTIGQQAIHYHTSTPSTNTLAKEEALQGAPEGTLIVAETQTDGHGRRGRAWFSGKQTNLSCSVILKPRIIPQHLTLLPLLTAVAIAEAIEKCAGIRAFVKWPNDLLVNDKKIGGVLTEAGFDLETIDYVVIGFGLNVNTPLEQFPTDLRPIATSLYLETQKNYERTTLLQAILVRLEELYLHAQVHSFDDVLAMWRQQTCTLGKEVTIQQEKETISGYAHDINEYGGLILRHANGQHQTVLTGDLINI